jgi:uncharacterized LabA/DUF88 family protein
MGRERVSIFIDGSNLYHSLKSLEVKEIDFRELINILVGDRKLVDVFYYNAPLDIGIDKEKYWEQQKFFNVLRNIPNFRIILCKMRKHKLRDGSYSFDVKGDDVRLTLDMVSGAFRNLYDVAIIVSGDEDFVPLVRRVRELGKKVENAFFKATSSNSLKKSCNKSINLNEIVRRIQK